MFETNKLSHRRKRACVLGICLVIACVEIGLLFLLGYTAEQLFQNVFTVMFLSTFFGVYFCLFAKEKLPEYYDENRVSFYQSGFFRMSIPGVAFNNSNWFHILRAVRIWCMVTLVGYPSVYFLFSKCLPELWHAAGLYILLVLVLGGLFIPVYVVGKKYESRHKT